MSAEMSGQCELCYNQSNQISIRVFPCLYHCKKMLCIQHLSEHDKYIDKQIQSQRELENLWTNFQLMFDEDQLEEQLQKLKAKLDNYRKLKDEVMNLLLINHFHDSIENHQQFQRVIQTVQQAMEQENQMKFINHNIYPKIESVMDEEEEEHRSTIDNTSSSSSMTTNDESEPIDSSPSLSNNNENMPPEEEYLDESEEHGNSLEMDNEDDTSFKDETNITPSRNITASRYRGYCPLTRDGVFGIDSRLHGICLCPNKSRDHQRTYVLNEHFRRVHQLTPLASLALARAVASDQDPMNTRLFSDHHIILNIDDLRTVNCPMNKPFLHYPLLEIDHFPCDTVKQVRHLKDHLKRVHKFTNQAANLIMKSVKIDASIHKIQFPHWVNILQNRNDI